MKYKLHNDVWSLLRTNLSAWQLAGYVAANVVGLAVILGGLLFRLDCRSVQADTDPYLSTDFAVLSKRVDGLTLSTVAFTDDEIDDMARQPWVRKLGRFTPSRFAANAMVQLGGRGMSSYIFFESVPDEFFEKKPRGWKFDPTERYVPIILSRDYLTLYNFGFAVPQGLPQVGEEMVGAVPIELTVTGRDMQAERFTAHVVGFSSRLNTIAVPQDFMDWANARYGIDSITPCSRVIVEADRLRSAEMSRYLERHELEVAGDRAATSRLSDFMSIVASVVTVNGLVICALAGFILVLSVFLLLQKSRDKLRCLMLLGYRPREVSRYYEVLVCGAGVGVTLLALGLTFAVRPLWGTQLATIGLGGAPAWPVFALALAYLLAVSALNVAIVRRHVLRIWADRQN